MVHTSKHIIANLGMNSWSRSQVCMLDVPVVQLMMSKFQFLTPVFTTLQKI